MAGRPAGGPITTPEAAAEGTSAPIRADARRNRTAILAAADAAFAQEGIGVPVDEIARRAGVGAGTLYRNFPTKEALFEAVIRQHMESLATEARELSASDHPAQALFQFVGHLAEQASRKRNLIDALSGAGIDVQASLGASKQEVQAAAEVLLRRAQRSGEVRSDVTLDDLFTLIMGACAFSPDATECAQARMVSVVCEGLRA